MRMAVWWLGLSLSLVFVVSCGDDSTPSSPTMPTPNGVSVSIVSGSSSLTTSAYNPNPITVQRGGSVTWINNDNTAHTSTSDTGAWSSGTIAPGASFSATFQTSGSFAYRCTIHPNMIGTVTVQ
jgi:plastocyanin